jgi:hypothetical protein
MRWLQNHHKEAAQATLPKFMIYKYGRLHKALMHVVLTTLKRTCSAGTTSCQQILVAHVHAHACDLGV